MNSGKRSGLALGLILILIGVVLLVFRFSPGLAERLDIFAWPVYVILVGLLLLVFGVLTGAPGMAVPAMIVTGIGGLLYWQNETGNWESWAYAWTLIPGFAGLGVVISGLFESRGKRWKVIRSGLWTLLISVLLFLVFGSFFGLEILGAYWPVLLVLLGLILIWRAIVSRRD